VKTKGGFGCLVENGPGDTGRRWRNIRAMQTTERRLVFLDCQRWLRTCHVTGWSRASALRCPLLVNQQLEEGGIKGRGPGIRQYSRFGAESQNFVFLDATLHKYMIETRSPMLEPRRSEIKSWKENSTPSSALDREASTNEGEKRIKYPVRLSTVSCYVRGLSGRTRATPTMQMSWQSPAFAL